MAKTFKRYHRGKIPFQEATRCIFCGSTPLTHEHVFSRWTHRFLPPRSMRKYYVVRVDAQVDRSDRFLIKRAGDIRDWQIQCVCETTCNNGWMRRRIENTARPIMMPLIDGEAALKGETTRIFPHQQKIIASWAVLKAMIAEYDAHSWVTTHHSQRQYLGRVTAPPPHGWTVWIGPYLRVNWLPHWASFPFLYLSPKQELRQSSNVRATYYNSHISTQVIGRLFIHVIRSPARDFIERWRFSLPDKGSFFRIWPPSNTSIVWPGQFMTDRDANYVTGALYNFIMDRTSRLLAAEIERTAAT